jgi:hypothetical protein
MHSPALFALPFAALAALPPCQEPMPKIERLEVPRIELAPIRAMELPARGIPDEQAAGLAEFPDPPLLEETPQPYVAQAGRLKLLAHREVVGEPIPTPRAPDAWEEDEEDPPVVVIQPEFRLAKANFDNWVFGNMNSEALRREWLVSVLDQRLSRLVEQHGLTESQLAKLRIAAGGDVKRFYAEVATARAAYDAARSELPRAFAALQEAVPLNERFQLGPFDEGSLFAKTLAYMTRAAR